MSIKRVDVGSRFIRFDLLGPAPIETNVARYNLLSVRVSLLTGWTKFAASYNISRRL